MDLGLRGKTVAVTGAAGGIGTAIAKGFAEDGARVACCDLHGAEETVKAVKAAGGEAASFDFDITDRAAVAAGMAKIKETFGRLDVLVNNAGINVGPNDRFPIDGFRDKWWDAIENVDLNGTYNCSKAAIPLFPEGEGVILNISSVVGLVPLRNQCAFAAAKAGVVNLTKAMAIELAERGIRVNCVAPGSIGVDACNLLWTNDEKMKGLLSHIPMGRQGTAEEIANVVRFVCSPLASYMTGAAFAVDGGWTAGGYVRNF